MHDVVKWFAIPGAVAVMGLSISVLAADTHSNSDCLECHSDKTLVKTNAAGQAISLYVDEAKYAASAHRTNACASCHSDLKKTHPDDEIAARPVNCATCHHEQSDTYGASVHGLAAAKHQADAATCKDCHGTHEVLPPTSPASPLHYSKLAATCGDCHPRAAADVQASVHGRSAAKGSRDAATCTDCHSEHQIQALKASSSLKIAEQICSKCHASERISSKYHLPADRVKTFFESYHGLAAHYGSTRAANCASCHGVHKILPSSDPASTIHPDHLVETCGQCHPGATENFAKSKVHVNGDVGAADIGGLANLWVRRIYLGLIVGTIGFMLMHNGLAWIKNALAARRTAGRTVLRMNAGQRTQHLVLLASFIVLAVTGFALRFPNSWVAWLLGSDESIRRWSHRSAGVILLAVGFYHLYYVLLTNEGRRLLRDFWPRLKDVRDLWQNLTYLAGRSGARPKFGRFGYAEKMEYWAVMWGTVIMGVTGIVIWFAVEVTHWWPRWIIDVATTIHYYEAILACLAIVVWHFYHVMFDPAVYPLNWAWWDGRVTPEWQQHEHPLDQPPAAAAGSPAKDVGLTGKEIAEQT